MQSQLKHQQAIMDEANKNLAQSEAEQNIQSKNEILSELKSLVYL